MSTTLLALLGLAAVASMGCQSSLAPGACENGHDGLGRGPIVTLSFTCSPSGSDLQCTSGLNESSYCAVSGTRDVTSATQWSSSNPAIATFTAPGLLHVLAPGQIEVTPTYAYQSAGPQAYTVGPGLSPETMVSLLVVVEDVRTAFSRIVDASVDVEPARGPAQHCQSNANGACTLWVFRTSVRVRVSKPGFQNGEAVAPAPETSLYQGVTVKLSPAL